MPRALSEYTLRDWLRLRPPLHRWKERRYAGIEAAGLAQPHRFGDVEEARRAVRGRRVLVTVSFEDPEALDMHRRLVRRYVEHDVHLIVDNSQTSETLERNRQITEQHGALYLAGPPNPWTGKNGSRSHGFCMTWAWRAVLRPGRPRAFGFLDDDLYPTAPVDPFALLAGKPFHGDIRWAGNRWFLWAGYCFFDFAAVENVDLDFGLDWFAGLDTGGANWERLYRGHDAARVPVNALRHVPALPDHPVEDAAFEWRGDWLHEVGWATRPDLAPRKREVVRTLLAPHLGPADS